MVDDRNYYIGLARFIVGRCIDGAERTNEKIQGHTFNEWAGSDGKTTLAVYVVDNDDQFVVAKLLKKRFHKTRVGAIGFKNGIIQSIIGDTELADWLANDYYDWRMQNEEGE